MKVRLPSPIPTATPPDLHRVDLAGAAKADVASGSFRIKPWIFSDGPSAGVELLVVDTGRVQAAICPTRGMNLWKAVMDGQACGWNSPVPGPIHPSFVALEESSGLGWLDGFDELLARCGLRSFGAPDFNDQGQLLFPLHGRVSNSPARDISVTADAEHSLLKVSGTVWESRFLQYSLRLDATYIFTIGHPTIEVQDRVVNAGGTATKMQMLYHINLGPPFLGAGSKMNLASERVVARDQRAADGLNNWQTYQGPTPGFQEQVYFFQPEANARGWTKVQLNAPDEKAAFAVHFDATTLPCFTQWKNTVAEADGYVAGLEPGTGFPNPRSFEEEKGRLVELAAGQYIDFNLKLEAITDEVQVQRVENEISDLRPGSAEPLEFDPDWCTPR